MFLTQSLRTLCKTILDDYQCLICNDGIAFKNSWCLDCSANFQKIKQACPGCRLPQAHSDYCEECRYAESSIQKVYCDYVYTGTMEHLIKKTKYSYQPYLPHELANIAIKSVKNIDAIVAVPAHDAHLWKRRYNQAALLAQQLANYLQKPLLWKVLEVEPSPKSQTLLNRAQRLESNKSRFKVKCNKLIQNKTLLLVDDVMTTGSTLQACASLLKQHGAKNIDAWVLARVAKGVLFENS